MNTNMNMITVVFLSAFISIIACLTLDVDDLYAEMPEAPVKVDLEKSVNQLFTQLARQSQTSQTKKVDFVFIIDTGISMYDHIKKLLPALGDLGYIGAQSNLDCRFGLVKFWELAGNPQIEIYSTLTSADLIQKNLASFAAMPKEFRRKSGCGLDAIFKAMVEIPYRTDSLRHLILITDQPLRSSQPGSEEKLVSEIISRCSSAQSAQTQVSIIGVSESFSAMLTGRTKGGWQPIFPYTGAGAKPSKPSISEVLGKHLLKIDGSIKEVAKHIAETCKPTVDVVFMIDSSDSMANKVDEIIEALPIFTETFDKSKLNYQFGEGFSVLEVVEMISKVSGRDIPIVEAPRRKGDPAVLVASSELAKQELGWKPKYDSLEEIIWTAWEWHRRHPDGYSGAPTFLVIL